MDNTEFLLHVELINEFLELPHVKIFLWHHQYTEFQQKTIDTKCSKTKRIIGQLEQAKDDATREKQHQEIVKMMEADEGPLIYNKVMIPTDQVQTVILGGQTPK